VKFIKTPTRRLAQRIGSRLSHIRNEVAALSLAAVDPRVPWYAKAAAAAVAAYALSPIDLIPDFIPVLGYLDDVVIVPLGVVLAVRLVPRDVMNELRATARARSGAAGNLGVVGAAIVVLLWIVGVVLALRWALHSSQPR